MVFMAWPAFFNESKVSLLMLAVSMEKICFSKAMICPLVCSRDCSNCFFRRRAALATGMRCVSKPGLT